MPELFLLEIILLAGCCVALGWQLRTSRPLQPGRACVNLQDLAAMESNIIMKIAELNAALGGIVTQLNDVGTQLEKAKGEILTALTDVEVPAEAAEKIEALAGIATALKTASQALDDIKPDVNPD